MRTHLLNVTSIVFHMRAIFNILNGLVLIYFS